MKSIKKVLSLFVALTLLLTYVGPNLSAYASEDCPDEECTTDEVYSGDLSGSTQLDYTPEDISAPFPDEEDSQQAVVQFILPALYPVVSRAASKLLVRQYLKSSTKNLVIRNHKYAGKSHPVTNVKFSKQGFPIFKEQFAMSLSKGYWKSSHSTQFRQANKALLKAIQSNSSVRSKFTKAQIEQIKSGITPKGYTWHHHEIRGRMELVDSEIHRKTGHTGGASIWAKL